MRSSSPKMLLLSLLLLPVLIDCQPARAEPARKIAARTEYYEEKEGFERKRLDIINTLKDNEVARFGTLLDGLSQAYDLDKTLKNTGPFTLFAPSDKAFDRMPTDDLQSLFGNKKKLKQVLEYHIVPGKVSSTTLKSKKIFTTVEGHEITITERGKDLYADKALIKVTDLPCTNGMIHVIENVVMPPLSK